MSDDPLEGEADDTASLGGEADTDPFEWDDSEPDPFDEDDASPFDEDDASPFDGDDASPFDEADANTFAELETDHLAEPSGVFERMEVEEIDVDEVWDALDVDLDQRLPPGPSAGVAAAGETETDHVVSKRSYCQRCPYFADPPETACTHDGTAILESIGFDEFRVHNCPMVADEGPQFDRNE